MRALPAALAAALLAATAQAAEPRSDAFTVATFEAHGCIMTEDQLFAAYQAAGSGLLGASRAVIALSTRSDVLREDAVPPVYRFRGSPVCRRAVR